jgi:hypothetical protein
MAVSGRGDARKPWKMCGCHWSAAGRGRYKRRLWTSIMSLFRFLVHVSLSLTLVPSAYPREFSPFHSNHSALLTRPVPVYQLYLPQRAARRSARTHRVLRVRPVHDRSTSTSGCIPLPALIHTNPKPQNGVYTQAQDNRQAQPQSKPCPERFTGHLRPALSPFILIILLLDTTILLRLAHDRAGFVPTRWTQTWNPGTKTNQAYA